MVQFLCARDSGRTTLCSIPDLRDALEPRSIRYALVAVCSLLRNGGGTEIAAAIVEAVHIPVVNLQ